MCVLPPPPLSPLRNVCWAAALRGPSSLHQKTSLYLSYTQRALLVSAEARPAVPAAARAFASQRESIGLPASSSSVPCSLFVCRHPPHCPDDCTAASLNLLICERVSSKRSACLSLSLSVFAITIFLAPLSKPPSGRTAALLPQNTPPRPCDQRANQAAMAKALAGPCIQGPLPLSPTASLQPQLAVSSPSPLSTIILNLKPPCPPAPTALRYFALHERGCASAAVWPSLPVPPPAFSFPFSSSPFSSPSHISLRLWAAFLFLCACACACACV